MFYVLRLPCDDPTSLDWFQVHSTRAEAMRTARLIAQGLSDDDGLSGWEMDEGTVRSMRKSVGTPWKVVYLSLKKQDKGQTYLEYEGKRALVVEQSEYLYHGA